MIYNEYVYINKTHEIPKFEIEGGHVQVLSILDANSIDLITKPTNCNGEVNLYSSQKITFHWEQISEIPEYLQTRNVSLPYKYYHQLNIYNNSKALRLNTKDLSKRLRNINIYDGISAIFKVNAFQGNYIRRRLIAPASQVTEHVLATFEYPLPSVYAIQTITYAIKKHLYIDITDIFQFHNDLTINDIRNIYSIEYNCTKSKDQTICPMNLNIRNESAIFYTSESSTQFTISITVSLTKNISNSISSMLYINTLDSNTNNVPNIKWINPAPLYINQNKRTKLGIKITEKISDIKWKCNNKRCHNFTRQYNENMNSYWVINPSRMNYDNPFDMYQCRNPNYLYDAIVPGMKYNVQIQNGQQTFIELSLQTSSDAIGEGCNISPSSGIAFKTTFIIICDEYTTLLSPLKYNYILYDLHRNTSTWLKSKYSLSSKYEFNSGSGYFRIRVLIKNNNDYITHFDIPTIIEVVNNVTCVENGYNNYLNSLNDTIMAKLDEVEISRDLDLFIVTSLSFVNTINSLDIVNCSIMPDNIFIIYQVFTEMVQFINTQTYTSIMEYQTTISTLKIIMIHLNESLHNVLYYYIENNNYDLTGFDINLMHSVLYQIIHKLPFNFITSINNLTDVYGWELNDEINHDIYNSFINIISISQEMRHNLLHILEILNNKYPLNDLYTKVLNEGILIQYQQIMDALTSSLIYDFIPNESYSVHNSNLLFLLYGIRSRTTNISCGNAVDLSILPNNAINTTKTDCIVTYYNGDEISTEVFQEYVIGNTISVQLLSVVSFSLYIIYYAF